MLKCSKQQPDLAFPSPGEGPLLRSLFESPREHVFYRFRITFDLLFWYPLDSLSDIVFELKFEPSFEVFWKSVLANEREARRKLSL